ncbi:hypothetical protein [Primorskyibacter flagellatus]|uniref:Antifreeze protein n=1 Tax=Primorskyibacter flagellatus TaxID=1387277 RepID=A0A1W1Z587_9RHOB|nr:hypothetical protein [Primorskyibacter flagellatus]SMC43605.1 hypothetical protein SAMN06295998_101254 [Primorskyibacter flagellatus]
MRNSTAAAILSALTATTATAQEPLSAIDWLELNVPSPVAQQAPRAQRRPQPQIEPPTSQSARSPEVSVMPLDQTSLAAVGLLPPSVTGLPADMWVASSSDTLEQLIAAQPEDGLPAINALLFTLLLAEADPPADAGSGEQLLAARTAKLMDMGAVEPAMSLIERAGSDTPVLFRLWFDLSLLTGQTGPACAQLAAKPHLAPGYGARIFCSARDSDWSTAMTTLGTARAIDALTQREASLLERFLDPELAEELAPLTPPVRPTPLEFRLFEALGEPLPTATLPRPFATVNLNGDAGWKAQLAAAERLARVGAISENRMLGIYTDRLRAASGGIWDRVEGLQRFDTALASRDPQAISAALERVWPLMLAADLVVPFSRLYGASLMKYPLSGRAADLATQAALLSPDYEMMAAKLTADSPFAFAAAIARGDSAEPPEQDATAHAIAAAFAPDAALPDALAEQLADDRLGEVLLRTTALMRQGMRGDPGDLTDALIVLRSVGLEDAARRAALQLLLAGPGQL